MPSLADLNESLDRLDTAKQLVADKATALIAATREPVPQSVIDRIDSDVSSLNTTAANLEAAMPPP